MAHQTLSAWICDRCHRTVSLPPGDLPAGWHRVTGFPVDENAGGNGREWEICGACYGQMERLLMDKDNVDAAVTPRENGALLEVSP